MQAVCNQIKMVIYCYTHSYLLSSHFKYIYNKKDDGKSKSYK